MKDELYCPYCNEKLEFVPEDFAQEDMATRRCSLCKKNFRYSVRYRLVFASYQAPCLNGESDHKYKKIGDKFTESKFGIARYRCVICDDYKAEKIGPEENDGV